VKRALCLLPFLASAAWAGGNDLQLRKLGHPDALGCTACTGAPGDVGEPGDPLAQARFHRLASTLGLAFAPAFHEPAGTLGQAGFEVGASSNEAFLRIPSDAWATNGGPPPQTLVLPSISVRKGLGGSFELAASIAWLTDSQMMGLSGELRWAALDGLAYAPDVALRAWGTRVIGTQELDLAAAGGDLMVSKSFGTAGMMKLQPYGSFGLALINALSSVVDFKPGLGSPARPGQTEDAFHPVWIGDNRYLRGTVGVRLLVATMVVGVEGTMAGGRNAIQHDPLSGAAPPEQYVRLTTISGHLGVTF
jgi:hypothetical protein